MSMTQAPLPETASGYRHEAFLYSGPDEFLVGAVSFIRRAIQAGDPILVVVSQAKIGRLRRELAGDAERVRFADMADVGGNPGRIIAAWRAFVAEHAGAPQVWGIGEPVHPDRSPTELAECQLHEALLNVAFDASTPFWLLCPYDLEALTADVIDEAQRTHPFIARGDDRQAGASFRPVDVTDPFARTVPAGPPDAARMSFERGGLRRMRAFVAGQAQRAGLDEKAASAMVAAVNEVATNSLQHGGGHGELRVWKDERSVVCEVSDDGHITSPLAGRLPPVLAAGDGGGLWLANQLCDLVQIYSSADGTAVRVYQDL
jgi:anti-sigma regulatory factor (Ser/Thr protein kinase)